MKAKYTGTNSIIKSNNTKRKAKYKRTNSSIKFNSILVDSDTSPSGTSNGAYVWEGLLQLNISTMMTVVGIFKRGEKTSTEEWPSLLEIKGRIRLNAFDKFLQELPMS
ncbi:hypothetical protein NE237_027274 [Protea cynaroides]|uniref:Spen paralogue and orthologue SPOC C-terminal domain-containing protein n=1 Tax=Protea cynaroides TaxID=273540 RepID=A0A9Q0GR08_9MAGN|nr:hypothetical protein NE237_027274 [Protea cynaroides]